jgi:hypothetical protein
VTSPLDNHNPHGIRVVADRAPVREDVKEAFARGSRKASSGLASLRKSRAPRAATARRAR